MWIKQVEYLKRLDQKLLAKIYQQPFERTVLIRALIFIGDGPFWLIVLVGLALAGFWFNQVMLLSTANLLVLGLLLGNLVFVPLKSNVKRRRPYANTGLQQSLGMTIENRDPGHGSKEFESFPSGHALWPTISVLIIGSQFGLPVLLMLVWLIPAMMWLRPHLGVHYPSDALVGFLLGLSIAMLTISFSEYAIEMSTMLLNNSVSIVVGYWLLIAGYVALGIRAWLKRV